MDQASPPRLSAAQPLIAFNPADYFTLVLDHEMRAAGMPGGYCGFVLELGAEPGLERLQQRLDLLTRQFPQASARLERRGKRYFWAPTGRRIALECHACPAGGDQPAAAQALILDIFNRPAPLAESLPLTLHWIACQTGGMLLLNWMHPLLDARGGKILLDYLCSDAPEKFQESPPLIGAKLAQWTLGQKIRYALRAKRHNDAANRMDSCLPTLMEQGQQALRLRVRRYDLPSSQRIAQLALKHTGMAGKTLYTLGCFMRAMEQAGPPAAKAGYCIPYAFNLRRQNAPTPIFGNQISCVFARASRAQTRQREALFAHLLAQHRDTVRQELDLAYLPLMWLGQWLSPARYARLLRKQHSGGELSSVWFSDIGELRWRQEGFLGAPVTGMFHLCWMTLPPGLALLAGQSNGQLSLSFSYLHPAVDEAWLERLIACMDAELLERAE
jgi:hypothetical protein